MDSSPVRDVDLPCDDFLTPRAKVAKMLQDIDDAPTPSSPHESLSHRLQTAGTTLPIVSPQSPIATVHAAGSTKSHKRDEVPTISARSNDSEDDSENDVRRPKGRAVRRMLGLQSLGPDKVDSGRHERTSVSEFTRAEGIVDEDDELYSATPLKARLNMRRELGYPTDSVSSAKLFVSPAKSNGDEDSGEDLPDNPLPSKERLHELVAAKRAERVAREEEEAATHRHRSSAHASSDLPDDILEDHDAPQDAELERIMSDAVRPTRKASKKALLEMERETQRLARQTALTHQMKTKKKFTTFDLFARFNFRQPQQQPQADLADDTTASSAPNSDGAEISPKEPVSTPPSSPPSVRPTPLEKQASMVELGALSKLVPFREDSLASLAELDDDQEDLPDIAEVMRVSQLPKAITALPAQEGQAKKGLKLARLGKKAAVFPDTDSSDDDLEIIRPMPSHLRAFDNIKARPTNESGSRALHNLKHLSHIGAYGAQAKRKGGRPSINPNVLEALLRQKAKEQARRLQLERIEELRAKGIEVQTTEERDPEAEVFESLLEKARKEAVELRKVEKAQSREGGEPGGMASEDEDEDEEYVASGSEGDEVDEEEEDEDDDALVDEAAEEKKGESEDEVADDGMIIDEEASLEHDAVDDLDEEEDSNEAPAGPRKSRKSHIIIDEDEDEDESEEVPAAPLEPQPTPEHQADPFAAFNFSKTPNGSLMSSTQAFQATMQTPTQFTQEDSMDILRRIAPPSVFTPPPIFDHTQMQSQVSVVLESQVPESQRISLDWETQPPETPVHSLARGVSSLSETPGWEPTQDDGLPSPRAVRFQRDGTPSNMVEEHETQSTVQLRVSESPAAPMRRGRLVRRQAALLDSDEEETGAELGSLRPAKKDAFREMAERRAAALTATERDEADKEMRRMIDEQAEESEDEYAGLGGDDFVAPETEEDKAMIDSGHVEVDERALAAHYAERERVRQEEETSKLYKDLTTGGLRRKQANMFDLDEDEDEVAVRRRQMRQREEARKRKLLLQDDNIAGLAQGKPSVGKDAFLKALADDDEGEDALDLSDGGEDSQQQARQDGEPQSQQPKASQALRETSGNKRPFVESEAVEGDRPPAKQRRTQVSALKRPTSMLEVKESVSFLLDEPDAITFAPMTKDAASDGESEPDAQQQSANESSADDEADLEQQEMARQNNGGYASNSAAFDALAMPPPPRLPASQRRTAPKSAVVDRLSLKRGASTSSATANSTVQRSAWATGGNFTAPNLLRRATIASATGANDRGVTTGAQPKENSAGAVKMGGTKKSSLAYQARADERKAIVEASAKRRAENTARIAVMRRNSSVLGRGLTGRFE